MAENTPKNEFAFLETLSAGDAELPKITRSGGQSGGRQRALQNNPFVGWLQESYTSKTGKSVKVPAAQVVKTEYLIRQAADDLGIGVRIVRMADGVQIKDKKKLSELHSSKHVQVMFQGKERRKWTKRNTASADTTSVETASENKDSKE